ncbi:DUF6090 family protein [Algoriphagus namhaensis]|uniref:DUF6090 family protein n=1 Tax=Algoriphagus namhaensis TaxID=915353 RepID=A0ABV8ANH9_9BACT
MIKFFRKIRFDLMNQNKPSSSSGRTQKYLKYAIGEIFLVVIGILIALQINTWNEERKASIQELNLLENIYDDINYNLDRITIVFIEDSIQNYRNKKLLEILSDTQSKYDDSLQIYFGTMTRYDVFSPRRTAYEAIKSRGLELIRNKGLRSRITELYDEIYILNELVLDLRKDIHLNSIDLLNDRFLTLDNVQYKTPINFEDLKSDQKFFNSLSYITAESENFLSHHKNMQTQTEALRALILAEIKKD